MLEKEERQEEKRRRPVKRGRQNPVELLMNYKSSNVYTSRLTVSGINPFVTIGHEKYADIFRWCQTGLQGCLGAGKHQAVLL